MIWAVGFKSLEFDLRRQRRRRKRSVSVPPLIEGGLDMEEETEQRRNRSYSKIATAYPSLAEASDVGLPTTA
ncbi:hypothetical protein OPV22_019983 [Ensete ventricosum]|uniref:Uncharacterized protein n=1 Tax=Ensete ventricosum TaxID=4639 RepID=A0AAV8P9E1_ENSVE|nr:hypothetical protein OPV22_019983 [Ensete ventricosum]